MHSQIRFKFKRLKKVRKDKTYTRKEDKSVTYNLKKIYVFSYTIVF